MSEDLPEKPAADNGSSIVKQVEMAVLEKYRQML